MARICAACRQSLDDPRDHDCPADLEPDDDLDGNSGPRADGSDEGGGIVTTITASQAQPGDVVLDSAQTEWKRGPDFRTWSTFDGLVVYEGPWDDAYGPVGDLTLLVRDGKPVITA